MKQELRDEASLGPVSGLYSQAIRSGDLLFTTQIGNVRGRPGCTYPPPPAATKPVISYGRCFSFSYRMPPLYLDFLCIVYLEYLGMSSKNFTRPGKERGRRILFFQSQHL